MALVQEDASQVCQWYNQYYYYNIIIPIQYHINTKWC